MSGEFDKVKGKIKETAGDVTNDDDLKREGKVDRAGGEVKEKAEDAKDAVGGLVDKVKDKLHKD